MVAYAYVDVSDLIGIPFKDGGRDRNGADCWGLFKMAQERFGNHVPDVSVSAFDSPGIREAMANQMFLWEPVEDLEPGDAIAMSLDYDLPDTVQHFAVYIGDGKMIHTVKKVGSMMVRIDHPLWKNKIIGAYRWIK